jgi:hypothetical protein
MAHGYTCRCFMCGKNDSKQKSRMHYIRAGFAPTERKPKGADKVEGRRRLRHRLKNIFDKEVE